MSNLRRFHREGNIYFITNVTYNWDHVIRNQLDMNRHIDYILYNPVRHGLVKSPFAWRESSLHEYGRKGYYPPDWGQREALAIEGDFGE